MSAEMGSSVHVIATGGLAPMIAAGAETIDEVDEWLTLNGLKILQQRNVAAERDS